MRAGDRLVMDAVRRGGSWPVVLAVTAVAGAAAELALPYAAGRTVDALTGSLAGGTTASSDGVLTGLMEAFAGRAGGWLVACVALVACVMLCESVGVWARGASGARAAALLRLRVLRHVLGAGPAATRRFPEGELATRAGLNAEEAGRAPETVTGALALLVPTAGALVALTLIHPVLTVALAAGIVLVLLVLRGFLRTTTAIAGGYQEAQGEIAARLVGALDGARTIAAAGTAGREADRVLAPLEKLRRHGLALWRANASAGVRAGLVVPLAEVAVLAAGGLLLASGELTVGELYAAARYAVLGSALSTGLGLAGALARARSAGARLADLLAIPRPAHGSRSPAGPPTASAASDGRTPSDGETLPLGGVLDGGSGTLEFRGVAAHGLSVGDLVIPGGSVTAVVGRSGSGKSLLTALAARLLDPERGTILLDGVPLPELSHDALRRAIGCAFDRPVLVGDTIGDAIALGLPGAAPDAATSEAPGAAPGAVVAAAAAARADGFVRRLPQGYATPIPDAPLSGGERQRIGLARAFAQAGRLLVLDDATSSLDTVTERQVGRALTADPAGRTRLIAAHRVATAARASLVVWLDDGTVRATGTHADLWHDPSYRAVFQDPAPDQETPEVHEAPENQIPRRAVVQEKTP
ncbi:ABC transporter ATP-binding protein [Nonomuraea roseoviolacea subsp. roseoviolacea]|uniref:ATP-binding cassette subfamily B protein n=1 Tax=Nonomuraea roseoviolacea subsp. carminata TaxID=160689 RepID=A0ABT1K8N9_9ACTN|nr:ABC transporter ATP-binding protein [Nonomuraea roseoviolacea]MCP2350372.1 ATP-binding cassette subfamily B protein [Nonomuraea roseoviolacea subsp. carminata]